jgi:hypothetical protein
VLQSTLGSIGTETDYVSNLRRAPVCHIPTATREQEMRRLVAPDPTVDRHGPADYTTEIPEHKPAAIFGTTKRATGPRLSDGPGPAVLVKLLAIVLCALVERFTHVWNRCRNHHCAPTVPRILGVPHVKARRSVRRFQALPITKPKNVSPRRDSFPRHSDQLFDPFRFHLQLGSCW